MVAMSGWIMPDPFAIPHTCTVSPSVAVTLPLAIFTYTTQPGGDAPLLRLVLISIGLSLIALLASEILARRVSARLGGT